jgi:hypothetical protein
LPSPPIELINLFRFGDKRHGVDGPSGKSKLSAVILNPFWLRWFMSWEMTAVFQKLFSTT